MKLRLLKTQTYNGMTDLIYTRRQGVPRLKSLERYDKIEMVNKGSIKIENKGEKSL